MAFDPFTIGAASAVGTLATTAVRGVTQNMSQTPGAFASALSSAVQSAQPQTSASSALAMPGDLFASFYQGLTGRAPEAPDDPIRIEDIRQNSTELLSQLNQRIQDLLESGGIDIAGGVRITQDGSGAFRVAGEHPEKPNIEYLLAQDPQLSQDFSRLSGMISLVEAADAHSEFAKSYDSDPKSAVAKYGHLLDNKQDSSLEILLGELEA